MFDFTNKVVLVTGGAAGIGASIVRTVLHEGVKHITILDVAEENGFAIQEKLNNEHGGGKVKFIKCDVSESAQLIDAFQTVVRDQGYIDVVINNAGILNDKVYAKLIEVNFTALVGNTLQAWELMRKDKGGRGGVVVNIASIAGLCSFSVAPIYSATKAAVLKFSTTLGNEEQYTRSGVCIISVCFGLTNTTLIVRENLDSFDPVLIDPLFLALHTLKVQTSDHAAEGLVEATKRGKSGSVWIVTSGRPDQDITEKYMQSVDIFHDVVFN